MSRWKDGIAAVAVVGGAVSVFILPFDKLVGRLASLAGYDTSNLRDVRDLANTLMAVIVIGIVALIAVRLTAPVPDVDTTPRELASAKAEAEARDRTYTVGEVVQEIGAELDRHDAVLTIVGYSLSWAEALRHELDTTARPHLKVVLAVPKPSYLRSHCQEKEPVTHRIKMIDKRIAGWRELQEHGRVRQVDVRYYATAPDLFAVSIGSTVFFGRYPFEHQPGGRHVLHPNHPNHRKLLRVEQGHPEALYCLLRQTIDARSSE